MNDADREKVKEIRERSAINRALLASNDVSGLLAVIDRLEADNKLDREIMGDWLEEGKEEQARLIKRLLDRERRETAERCWNIARTTLDVPPEPPSPAGGLIAQVIAREFGLEKQT